MASSAAAMPPEPARNSRRDTPSFRLAGIAQLVEACLYPLLLLRLGNRHVLAVRHHARGDRRAQRLGGVRAGALGDLLLVKQPVVVIPDAADFVPRLACHGDPSCIRVYPLTIEAPEHQCQIASLDAGVLCVRCRGPIRPSGGSWTAGCASCPACSRAHVLLLVTRRPENEPGRTAAAFDRGRPPRVRGSAGRTIPTTRCPCASFGVPGRNLRGGGPCAGRRRRACGGWWRSWEPVAGAPLHARRFATACWPFRLQSAPWPCCTRATI